MAGYQLILGANISTKDRYYCAMDNAMAAIQLDCQGASP
jgi:hypothetical protein